MNASIQCLMLLVAWEVRAAALQGPPHLQTQIQAVPVLSSQHPFLNWFSSFTFPGASYRIFFLFLPQFPCHFYLVIEQLSKNGVHLTNVLRVCVFIPASVGCVTRRHIPPCASKFSSRLSERRSFSLAMMGERLYFYVFF